MCNKTLVTLIAKANSNSCSKSFSCYSSTNININQMNVGRSNLTQFSISSRKLCGAKSSIHFKYCTDYNVSNISKHGLSTIGLRSYCSKKEEDLPKLMDFPQVVWPSVFKTVRNWVLSNFIIMRYFDHEFHLSDFVTGSKQAVELVSGMISRGDVDSLTGLVTPEVITHVRYSLNTFTLKQRQEFAIKTGDIFFCFPYEVGVMFPNEDKNEGENQSRFVEITMCYHVLLGLQELRATGISPTVNLNAQLEYQDKIFICNYRFIREFTKGVHDDWTINAINHFKPGVIS